MKLLYVAGPYRAPTISGVRENIERARAVAEDLWRMGYAVICPHLNSAFMDGIVSDEQFMEAGLRFLSLCDGVVVGGETMRDVGDVICRSRGTAAEIRRARDLTMPVWFVARGARDEARLHHLKPFELDKMLARGAESTRKEIPR